MKSGVKASVLGVFLLLCMAMTVLAAPFAENFSFTQPDGTEIVLFGRGDEFYAVFETLDGYAVVFNPQTKAYEYANLSTSGDELVPNGMVVGKGDPKALGIAKHVRINPAAVKKQVKERFQKWDRELEVSTRWNQIKAARRQADLNGSGSPMPSPADSGSDANSNTATSGAEPAPPSSTTTGTKVGLTLLIDFDDDPATVPQADIIDYCNGDNYAGYGNNGSVKKYFQDNSGGLLTYSNVVTVYIRIPNSLHPKSWYNNTTNDCGDQANLLIKDVIAVMKAMPNYATEIKPAFDGLTVDGSSRVVAFNVFYAGGNGGVWNFGLWPHSWSLYNVGQQSLGNGKSVYRYQITNIGTSLALKTFCHENGHMLCGFPDLYDYDRVGNDYDSKGGAGSFCLMGTSGSSSYNPQQICAYLKRAAGWATVTELTSGSSLMASLTASTNRFYRYVKPGVSTEYFIIENRQKTGRDTYLPASGIAIWHIDELGDHNNQSTNYNSSHLNYEVSLMQADNLWHFQNNGNSGDSKDLYYSGNSASGYSNQFNDFSAPGARWWDGTISSIDFRNFSASSATMTFDVAPPPSVTLSLSGSPMAESGGVATVTATLSSTYMQDVTVNLAFSGTATPGNDYTSSASSITIPAGSTTNSITLTAVQDTAYESNETIIVDISSVVNGTESGTQQVTATILDDDFELTVLPFAGVSFVGSTNGVASPSNQVYVLTNAGVSTLSWTASRTNSWVILSATNGTLAAGATTNVTVSVSIGALAETNYSDAVTFANTTREVSVTRPISLTVTPPYIYFFPLDANPGWTNQGEWVFGHPTGQGGSAYSNPDPANGATGTNVFGVNLNGNYSITKGGPYYLKAGPFNFAGYTNVSLHFQRWLNMDWGMNASATVEVSSNGTTWSQVYVNDTYAETISTEWSLQSINISQWADRKTNVFVRWGYQLINPYGSAVPSSGWNIDDIGFLGASTASVYTVTFDAQGGTAASPASKSVTRGSTYGTLAATARAGYAFGGWWTGAGGTGAQITSTTAVTITSAQTLYAMWTVLNTSQGTPCPWLDQYGLAAGGDYEAAALADMDGDGCAAWQEYIAGTNPTNGQSFFNVSSFELPSGGAVIRWNAVTGRVYGVHWATNLLNSFLPLATNIVWPQSSYTDTVHGTELYNFYEIKVRLSP